MLPPFPPQKKKRRENGGLCPSQRFGYDHVRFNNNIVREAEDLIRRSFLGTEGCPGSGVFFEHDIVCTGLLGRASQVIKRKAEGRK